MSCVYHVFLSFLCSLVITCWERSDLLARKYVKFSCVFVTFPCGVLSQVWYMILSIPDLCLPTYFNHVNSQFWSETWSGTFFIFTKNNISIPVFLLLNKLIRYSVRWIRCIYVVFIHLILYRIYIA